MSIPRWVIPICIVSAAIGVGALMIIQVTTASDPVDVAVATGGPEGGAVGAGAEPSPLGSAPDPSVAATGPLWPAKPIQFQPECLESELEVSSYGHPLVDADGRLVKVAASPVAPVEQTVDRFIAESPYTYGGSKQPAFRWEWAALPYRGPHDRVGTAYLGDRLAFYVEAVLLPDGTYTWESYELCVDYVEPDTRLPCDPNCQPGKDHNA